MPKEEFQHWTANANTARRRHSRKMAFLRSVASEGKIWLRALQGDDSARHYLGSPQNVERAAKKWLELHAIPELDAFGTTFRWEGLADPPRLKVPIRSGIRDIIGWCASARVIIDLTPPPKGDANEDDIKAGVVKFVREEPGKTSGEIVRTFPNAAPASVRRALQELRQEHRIYNPAEDWKHRGLSARPVHELYFIDPGGYDTWLYERSKHERKKETPR